MVMQTTRFGKPFIVIGEYKIVKHTDDFVGIYKMTESGTRIVEFKEEWSKAVEFANNISKEKTI